MKQGKKVIVFLLTMFIILFISACSGKGAFEDSQSGSPSDSVNEEAYDDLENPISESEVEYQNDEVNSKAETDEATAEKNQTAYERKIIKNATLEMEASDSVALYGKIIKYGSGLGGYEFSYDISNYETYSVIHAVYKIPPDKLNMLMNFAGETGKIINSTMSSEDITESYYDTKTRLESKRKSLEQYYALLQKAKTINEITKIQNIIDEITEDIEANEGKLKMWNNLVDMATVELYIRQENDPAKIKKEIQWNTLSIADMGYLIKSGLVSVLNAIVSILQWILIAGVVTSPLWIVAVIVLWIWFKKKRKQKSLKK